MTNFDFISRKVFFICTVNGDGVTINNTNYTTIDVDLLSQAELAVIAKGVQFMEIECSNPSGFDIYLSENSTGSTSGSLDTRYYTEAEIDSYFAGLTKSSVGLSNVQNVDTTTTLNINSSTDKRFVTDPQLIVIENTSNTNTGDETTASIKTKLGTSSTTTDGYLTSTDWNTFNNKPGLSDVRYVFLNDSTTQQTTYTVPASAVTATGRTIIELSNNSLTSITVDTNTGTNKSIGDSVNISITGLYAAQVLVASGVTLQGDLTFSYQHQTKTLVYKGTNTWKVVG